LDTSGEFQFEKDRQTAARCAALPNQLVHLDGRGPSFFLD
jgi:hypothetical protein